MKKNIVKIIVLIFIDQVIKAIICGTMENVENSISVIPNFIQLTYVENTGAAFGMFSGQILLIGVDIFLIIFIVKLLLNKKNELVEGTKLGLSMILAGGIANLIDRIFRGHVIDYIDISKVFDYPVFNFADICIVIGVILVIIVIVISTVQKQEKMA